jgi:para-aminobenzoate synthetase component I
LRRNIASFDISPALAVVLKRKMLNYSQQFSVFLFLDNNEYHCLHNRFESVLAVGSAFSISAEKGECLQDLQQLHDRHQDWLFGNICYDYKNVIEPKLNSRHPPKIGFPLLHFFIPETVCHINLFQTKLTIETLLNPYEIYDTILETDDTVPDSDFKVSFELNIPKEEYCTVVNTIKNHIREGDCYELNFCNEGTAPAGNFNPWAAFARLNSLSPAPYAAFYQLNDKYLICSSPERYLYKDGTKIVTEPIKGTAPRGTTPDEDEENRKTLRNSIKEQAENIMIVDLVRNDLARCCTVGSVSVDELMGIYSFPQVHQMISSVSGSIPAGCPLTEAIKCTFPMGSMTGAPKFNVMRLIDQFESCRRELFSGTVGYITPSGNFDFNVVIRSLFYNHTEGLLTYQTGGAITYDSIPEQEWDEIRLKALAMEKIFR